MEMLINSLLLFAVDKRMDAKIYILKAIFEKL